MNKKLKDNKIIMEIYRNPRQKDQILKKWIDLQIKEHPKGLYGEIIIALLFLEKVYKHD